MYTCTRARTHAQMYKCEGRCLTKEILVKKMYAPCRSNSIVCGDTRLQLPSPLKTQPQAQTQTETETETQSPGVHQRE